MAGMVICNEIYLFKLVSVNIYWDQVFCPIETGAVKTQGCVCVACMQPTMDAAYKQEAVIISASWIWIFLFDNIAELIEQDLIITVDYRP